MNQVTLVGRLVKDVELRSASNGTKYCFITLAVAKDGKVKEGQPDTDFIEATVFGKTAEYLAAYVSKGALLEILAQLHTRTVQENGQNRTQLQVVVNHVKTLLNGAKKQADSSHMFENVSTADISDDEMPY